MFPKSKIRLAETVAVAARTQPDIPVHLIRSHLVWTPKRRKAGLKDAIAIDGRRLIAQTCAERGWEMVDLTIRPDPIHLLVRVCPSVSAADGV